MLKSHLKYNSKEGKRQILIVDDEKANRDLLGFIVSADFDPLFAENGEEAMALIKEHRETLSLILLDILMPVMDGFEVMRLLRDDASLARIPVVVLTSAQEIEVESLKMGAFDFIVKPFRASEVILARIQKAVELSEDRFIIKATERESLTGLLAKDFFYPYAEQYDKHHEDFIMDALVFDINHFHLINEIYGRDKGDEVLAEISGYLKDLVERTGGMATRLEGDTFLFYVPDRDNDYEKWLRELNDHLLALSDLNVKLRVGVYRDVDKEIRIEARFDRAMRAANLIKDDYTQLISYYDDEDYQNDIYREQLINEMRFSLENEEFEVWFQPKYDISADPPLIASAEALVRWRHPKRGMISPGVFIPLFEENGMIQSLDHFVWEKAASYIRGWRDDFGHSVPISVNASRIDLFNHVLPELLVCILERYGLGTEDMYLEITESAYTDTGEQLLAMIGRLKERDFVVEMDDFGSGYSSLNMLADFPIDILKLDMSLVRDMTHNEKKARIVGVVMELAEALNIKVIAEGVEEMEQVELLRRLGCRLIQGYYFAKPMPEAEFRELLRKESKC